MACADEKRTYVPTMVVPSLAHTWVRGRRDEEVAGSARLVIAKIMINETLEARMLAMMIGFDWFSWNGVKNLYPIDKSRCNTLYALIILGLCRCREVVLLQQQHVCMSTNQFSPSVPARL